jgi:hypothetical protein
MDCAVAPQVVKKPKSILEKWAPHFGGVKSRTRPPGYETAEEVADAFGMSLCRASQILRESVSKGKAERIEGRNQNGRVCWFYRTI